MCQFSFAPADGTRLTSATVLVVPEDRYRLVDDETASDSWPIRMV